MAQVSKSQQAKGHLVQWFLNMGKYITECLGMAVHISRLMGLRVEGQWAGI